MFRSFDPDEPNDLTATFACNPASQITQTVRTGDTYAWTGHGNGSTGYTQNGLNQQVTIGGAAASWDAKGNLTGEPQSGKTYGYSSENLLTSASGGVTLGNYGDSSRNARNSPRHFPLSYRPANAIAESLPARRKSMSDVPWIARTHRLAGCPELDEVDIPPPGPSRVRACARVSVPTLATSAAALARARVEA